MKKQCLVALLAVVCPLLVYAGGALIPALLPPNLENDERALLAAARAVEPEVLDCGFRRYDLVAAHLAAWTQEKSVESKDLMVHLFLPPEEQVGPYPLLVYVHGGGFMGGNPRLGLSDSGSSFAPSFRHALSNGVALASIGYRLAREGGWPAPVSDPLCGMRFLQQHGAHWNLMTDRLVLVGHSAGARGIALIGMVPQDEFHTQGLPWQGAPVNIAGTLLWAGAVNTKPQLESFGEFGKPRWFSVPRLHHGEHPAWSDSTRHSIRIRNNFPHISNSMPPLYMVRGASDYGGDHSDAKAAVELWRALGIDAKLEIVPGGHSATGAPEDMLQFILRHIVEEPFTAPERDAEKTARVLIEQGEPLGALEVLAAAHTTAGGTQVGPGEWVFAMHDATMMWLPDAADWPASLRELAVEARQQAAELEAAAARVYFAREDWFRAAEAARNVRKLIGEAPKMAALMREIESKETLEAAFFRALHQANERFVAGEAAAAWSMLEETGDARTGQIRAAVETGFPQPVPDWADRHGVDLYGPWVAIDLHEHVALRLRRVAAGEWDLPEHLHYQPRGRVEDESVTRIEVGEGFWIAETAVTHVQWDAVEGDKEIDALAESATLPQVRKDYLDIIAWLEKFSSRHAELLVRLPTEPEWIHAATGGGRGDVRGGTDLHAQHALEVDPENPGPASVLRVTPDLMGLYGMIGGVQEWTASGDRRTARFNDERGRFRVFRYPMSRGGAWSSLPHVLGVDAREWHRHGNRQRDLGFRVIIGGDATADNWLDDVIVR